MALNVSAGQFVLPGSTAPDALMHLQQTMYQRNLANQRLELAKEAKREQAGTFIQNQLNPEHFGTGTVYDPVINQNLNAIRQQAFELAQKGADIPTIMQTIGPAMNKVNQYYSAAKTITKNVDDYLKAMHENKMDVGYKMGDLRQAALRSAFLGKDDNGNDKLNDPASINLSTNYVHKAIQDNPSAYTTDEALLDYAKNSAKSTRLNNITTHDQLGNTTKKSIEATGANWEIPEADAKGNIVMVPDYDHATDNGQVLSHSGPDGQQQPIRLFNEQRFDQMMQSRPAIADYIRGQVQQHLSEYKGPDGKPIDIGSPTAKLLARALAYQYLAANGTSTVKSVQDLNKPSSAEVQIHVFGNKEQQSYDRTMGSLEAKQDAGALGIGPQKTNPVQALIKVFNNDPSYLDGPATVIGGKSVVDITNRLPKAELRWGHGEKDAYAGAYYDPSGRTLMLKKKDGTIESIPEKQAGQFLARIAEANGVPLSAVKPALTAGGFSLGSFKNAAAAPDISGKVAEAARQARQQKTQKGLDLLDTDEDAGSKKLSGLEVPGGTIDKISVRGGFRTTFGASKYAVDVKGTDGQMDTKYFKDKDALKQFLNSGDIISSRAARAQAEYDRRKAQNQ
jgi:hypothetical protein